MIPVNDAPVITGQKPLSTPGQTPLTITLNDLIVSDPDNAFPDNFTLSVQDGENYTRAGGSELVEETVTPAPDFEGSLTIPTTVSDGADESNLFHLIVTVGRVEDDSEPVEDDSALNLSNQNHSFFHKSLQYRSEIGMRINPLHAMTENRTLVLLIPQ